MLQRYHSGQDLDNSRGYEGGPRASTWEFSELSTQFCCESKTALKNLFKMILLNKGKFKSQDTSWRHTEAKPEQQS